MYVLYMRANNYACRLEEASREGKEGRDEEEWRGKGSGREGKGREGKGREGIEKGR